MHCRMTWQLGNKAKFYAGDIIASQGQAILTHNKIVLTLLARAFQYSGRIQAFHDGNYLILLVQVSSTVQRQHLQRPAKAPLAVSPIDEVNDWQGRHLQGSHWTRSLLDKQGTLHLFNGLGSTRHG